ncbi:hypothetical protein [Halomonas koreensis]|uniref:Uncharacterized protein n=1 Tax=Halomonas koreensis TaxID=245385 RepID=A0ABU1G636_9GAMM|nr:hypothetical protein [Halomonas koreensis]MDR5867978.1 hypothetical protein [Halomonas koreensis]
MTATAETQAPDAAYEQLAERLEEQLAANERLAAENADLRANVAAKQAEAFRQVAAWLNPNSEHFPGPAYHEAEMIGMEISGPTYCSDLHRCARAGSRAFLEAARIWEHMAKESAA